MMQGKQFSFELVKRHDRLTHLTAVSFVLIISKNSCKTVTNLPAVVFSTGLGKGFHQSVSKIWTEVSLVPFHANTDSEVIKIFFTRNVLTMLPFNFEFF